MEINIRNYCLLVLLSFSIGSHASVKSFDDEILEQRRRGFEENSVLKSEYYNLCHSFDFTFQGSKKALCERFTEVLMDSSRQRQMTLSQFQLSVINNCINSEEYDEEECRGDDLVAQNAIHSTLALSLCEFPSAIVSFNTEYEQDRYGRYGRQVFKNLHSIVDCETGFFENDFNASGEFIIHSERVSEDDTPVLVDQLRSDIEYNEFALFQHRLDALDLNLASDVAILESVIFSAIESENIGFIQALIAKGVSVNTRKDYFYQPLMVALKSNHPETALLLLENGAVPDRPDSSGIMPLTLAAKKGYLKVVKRLLSKGVDVHGQMINYSPKVTPVVEAALAGRSEVVQLLFTSGASVSSSKDFNSIQGLEPLDAAALGGDFSITELFMAKGASLPKDTQQLVLSIIRGGNHRILKAMVALGLDGRELSSKTILSELHQRASMLNKSGDSNQKLTPCECAQLLTTLLDMGVKLDYEEHSAWGLVRKSLSLYRSIRLLKVREGAQQRLLEMQLSDYMGAVMSAAIKVNMDVNYQNKQGDTLLMLAAEEGIVDTLSALLKLGADSTVVNKNHQSALDVALKSAARFKDRSAPYDLLIKDDFAKAVELLQSRK